MDKDTLIKFVEELYWEAFNANSYLLIMQQYRYFGTKYKDVMRLSPAFYQTIYDALQKACFMEIAKLFDKSKDTLSIGSLLIICKENLSLFPQYRTTVTVEDNGNTYTFPVPYKHHLKPQEERFFKDQVQNQLFDDQLSKDISVQIDLTFSQFIELYQKRFCSLSKKQKHIQVQRNKIFAHNDEQRILDTNNVYEKNPVFLCDLQELTEFALDVTRLILGSLTDICRATSCSNIGDWEATLILAQLGMKQRDEIFHQNQET